MSRVDPTETTARQWWAPLLALAAVVYPPLLLSEPGTVVADTKTYLYLDPGRQLSRALSMWDPHTALGTVPHQQIGYLWPMGPYYWVMEQVGVPDWVAQRLWLGTILVAAGGGVLFLGRTWRWRPVAATAAAFAFALTPYVVTLATRLSAILLPFAGLPWLLALTVRALRRRGWRHPALFGLTVATIGSVNATALLLVGLVPVAWIIYAVAISGEVTRARAITTVAKIGLITVAVNLWWIVGLSVQATNGVDILRYSETAEVVNSTSTAPEVLRGLGYWFAYGDDRLDPWVEPAVPYTQNLWLLAVTFAIPTVALLALGIVRWRHRSFVIGLVVLGAVLAIGAYPFDSPPPVGAVIKAFLDTDIGLAMRSLPRAVPILALGVALGIGALVGAAAEQVPRRGLLGAVAAALVAYAALPPLWTGGFAADNLSRDEALPEYWLDVADHLEGRDDGTRVLELPGIDFASYRWGNTVDPITPGLIDRPYVARELVPFGSAASADLLRALDLRLQEGTLDPTALAPVARLMGVGDIVLRNDLQYERHFTARPRSMWDLLRRAPGLGTDEGFGPTTPNVASDEAPLIDEIHLARDAGLPDPPAVAVFPVVDARPIVDSHPDERAVLLSGSGDGIVDAAAAGLLEGDELIRYSAELTDDPDFLTTHLVDDRRLVVTDTNRKRGRRWTQLRYIEGFTETADGGLLSDDPLDARLPVQTDRPGTQTVAEHRGLTVRATDYGTPIGYYTEHRPVHAADGDPDTAWRVGAFDDAVGERIELTTETPVRTDHIRILQPQAEEANRSITEVELRFDGDDPLQVSLDATSLTPPGQRIDIGDRVFSTLSVEILADTAGRRPNYGGLTSVGFAEIDVAGQRALEVIRMPQDLLDAAGFRSTRYPLSLVQTRVRLAAADAERRDEERSIVRALELPATRRYEVRGTARLSTDAPVGVLDALLGRPGLDGGEPSVTADGFLPGGFRHLPSNVLDGDPSTVWTTRFAIPEQAALQIRSPIPFAADELTLTWLDDEEHSEPAAVEVLVDDVSLGTVSLEPGPAVDGVRSAVVPLPRPVTATSLRLRFPDVESRSIKNWYGGRPIKLPMAIAEVAVGGLQVSSRSEQVDTGCRDDLVIVDGEVVPVRITGSAESALDGLGLQIAGCQDAVRIPAGDRLFAATPGAQSGLDVDQLVWHSEPVTTSTGRQEADEPTAPTVDVNSRNDATVEIDVDGARPGDPFWLVFGQSFNDGWGPVDLDDGTELDGPHLVNGYANGFLVDPSSELSTVTLRFLPQNRVDVGLLVSAAAVVGALLLLFTRSNPIRPAPIPRQEPVRRLRAFTYEGALPSRRDAVVVACVGGAAGLLLANPVVAVILALVGGLSTRREGWRPLLTVAPAVLVGAVGIYVVTLQARRDIVPGLHWPGETGRFHIVAVAALLLLALDTVIEHMWRRGSHLE